MSSGGGRYDGGWEAARRRVVNGGGTPAAAARPGRRRKELVMMHLGGRPAPLARRDQGGRGDNGGRNRMRAGTRVLQLYDLRDRLVGAHRLDRALGSSRLDEFFRARDLFGADRPFRGAFFNLFRVFAEPRPRSAPRAARRSASRRDGAIHDTRHGAQET